MTLVTLYNLLLVLLLSGMEIWNMWLACVYFLSGTNLKDKAKFYYSVKVWISVLWNNLYISATPILYCKNFNINQQMASKEAKFLTLSRWQRSCLLRNFQATCCGGGIVVVLKMILIWEFRDPGILILGGANMHEREI